MNNRHKNGSNSMAAIVAVNYLNIDTLQGARKPESWSVVASK
ncbi:MAG TPA: hypothetical protein VIM79_22515 [Niastella sp.]